MVLVQAATAMTKANSSFPDEKAGLAKVNQGRYAMIMDRINLEYYAAENCSYMLLGEALTQVSSQRWRVYVFHSVSFDRWFLAPLDARPRCHQKPLNERTKRHPFF